jgi:hypothetical protein
MRRILRLKSFVTLSLALPTKSGLEFSENFLGFLIFIGKSGSLPTTQQKGTNWFSLLHKIVRNFRSMLKRSEFAPRKIIIFLRKIIILHSYNEVPDRHVKS